MIGFLIGTVCLIGLVKVLRHGGLNVRDILGHVNLVITRDALEAVATRLQRISA